jgi:LCP family protein required for cell wall assembly
VVGSLAFAGAGVASVYSRLEGNLDRQDVDAYLGEDRPTRPPADPDDPFAGKDMNILVMGTDLRDEVNEELAGAADGLRSDSTFLVHISGDRSRVEIVSIPRDSMLPIPSCQLADGTQTKARAADMFNSAFETGAGPDEDIATAAACTRLTFEQNTGVVTDEHVVIKMDGVVDVIDVLHGVPISIPEAMDSPKAGLSLAAGDHVLDGATAIAFLRARSGTGNGLELGSDLSRIVRQQQFIDALTAKVQGDGVLKNPQTLLQVLNETTQSLSVSSGLSITTMTGLGFSLRNLDPATVVRVTVPVGPYPADPKNRVEWTSVADELWSQIANDQPISVG